MKPPLLLALVLTACAPARPAANALNLDAVERRLLSARTIHVTFHLHAEGLYAAEAEGELDRRADGAFSLLASGSFDGEPFGVRFSKEGQRMTLHSGERFASARFDLAAPADLEGGVLTALARMGLLHDVSRLIEGSPPDAIDGSASRWVVIDSAHAEGAGEGSVLTQIIAYALHVEGGSRADGHVWLDRLTGLPARRTMVVHFAKGDMKVDETYARFEVSP